MKKHLESLEDNYLMRKVQDGDFSKMAELYERHHGALFGFFYRMNANAIQSEDLIQNVFYRLLKYRHTFKKDGQFVYWMYAIARNVSKDQFRKKDPIYYSGEIGDEHEITNNESTMEERMESGEELDKLKVALQKLDDEKREAIVLSKYQGLKYREIAAMTNVSENAIKARVRRGLLELREMMEAKI